MAPTSVMQQAFWDRIPNATSKRALQGRELPERRHSHDESPARISKRKQSHPTRSPLANSGHDAPYGLSTKARRLSLDRYVPSPHPICTDVPARAFRLSFSDDYLRHPQQYVQALLSCDTQLAAPAHRPHSSPSMRSRRATPHSKPKPNTSARRSRSRFHNLQLEQTVADTNSETDDANSVTTASDINDMAEFDSQVPVTPLRAHSRTAAETPKQDNALLSMELVLPEHELAENLSHAATVPETGDDCPQSCSASQKSDCVSMRSAEGSGVELHANVDQRDANPDTEPSGTVDESSIGSSSAPDSPDIPLMGDPQSLPSATADDNVPSFQRAGLVFAEDMDISLIMPLRPRSTVKWNKADPIDISNAPMQERLARAERHCCSVLRLLPEQFLSIKLMLLKEGLSRSPGTFKKRDAQRLCRIDVNKTSKIYEWFVSMGWLPGSDGVYANPPPPQSPAK
ncbi:hypothetical protein LPJ62_001466 [Coemansia sp. RSA 2167]|nr:hypothetical protein LPJ62_001466 [Coemansia sp. RSA 2167]KAJ1792526.1 hypothetical protein LPJ67_001526 [Coemansia sp. RSA 1938]KAJ2147934.1 hypothetical protein IW142_001300 [Coemansia sp. RSA 564]KAJ2218013.1 hypothetical protein EV180_005890 [Coemansia sp. RSA 518]KAJ2409121.1 hypothetical protein J3F80_001562 [Coemansia sp. RSA 2526]KAJ2532216.1 hypothetical protein IWW43_003311 [Coemansia sp. RSA 1935]KAJ2546439.1 hypothetical protein IWW35_005018 [Coemansia sp. RSA 1878]KAJ2721465.